jgi:hypothetical protein|tara:strand:+ start:879 stop:1259 length:381 start_codon:yes stop_codon:yes gene_type:complete
MSSNYLGQSPDQMVTAVQNRFLYGLRRTDQGELFLGKLDQMDASSSIQINKPGDNVNDYENFEEGSDLYEGRDVHHELVYSNLNYEQYQWREKNIWYYVNSEGELVASVNTKRTYDAGSSSNGNEG